VRSMFGVNKEGLRLDRFKKAESDRQGRRQQMFARFRGTGTSNQVETTDDVDQPRTADDVDEFIRTLENDVKGEVQAVAETLDHGLKSGSFDSKH
jgi:hypothetical protein